MNKIKKILVIEDNQELRSIYGDFLRLNEFDVELAANGNEGLEKARDTQPDLIFLDIMMPDKDGYEVLEALRHDKEYKSDQTKIVILTNLGDTTRINPDTRKDMDGYVVKAEHGLGYLLEIVKSVEETGKVPERG